MPHIKTTTNVKIDETKLETIKTKMGDAIRLLGKTEDWLMLEFHDNITMYFTGDNQNNIAYIEVKLYGTPSNIDAMTQELTNIISTELNINPGNIYITYQGFNSWGYNGTNL